PSVPITTFHPPSTSPTTLPAAVLAPAKNTSQNSSPPARLRMVRTSTPGWWRGTSSIEIPRWRGASRLVWHSTYSQSARCPKVVQTFCPSMTHSSPSSSARVVSEARSEPAPGSLKPCPHISSHAVMAGRNRCFCAGVPNSMRVGPNRSLPCTPTQYGASAAACSMWNRSSWRAVPPRPPYSAGHDTLSHRPAARARSHARRSSQHESSVGPPTAPAALNSPTRLSANQSRSSSTNASSPSSPTTSVPPQPHGASDGVALDLAGPAGDRRDDRLAVAEAHHAFCREPVPGEHLHPEARRGDVGFGPLQLGHRCGAAERARIRVVHPRCPLDEQPRRVDLGLHVGEGVGDRLELADRAPERVPLLGVRQRLVDRRLGSPDVAAADEHPFELEAREHELPTVVERPDEVGPGHLDIVEEQLVRAENV